MPFEFVHFIDEFIGLMGNDRTLSPLDYNRYFGKILSKSLFNRLKSRTDSCGIFSPKAWSLVLETKLSGENNIKFSNLLNETEKSISNNNDTDYIKLSRKNETHISWNFFGDCTEPFLSSVSYKMKEFSRNSCKALEELIQDKIEFNTADYFDYGNTIFLLCLHRSSN